MKKTIEIDRTVPTDWKTDILEKQKGKCAGKECKKTHGKKMPVDIFANFDHTKAIALGGKNIKSNVTALCANCHQRKTRKDREKIRIQKKKEKKTPKKSKKKTGKKKIIDSKMVLPLIKPFKIKKIKMYKPPVFKW